MPASLPHHRSAIAALLVAFAAPATAQAIPLYTATGAECRLAAVPGQLDGPALADPLGYRFDVSHNGAWGVYDDVKRYAVLEDGGRPGAPGSSTEDAYDHWGDLFVGATQSAATQYFDADRLGCSSELGGRQLAFKPVVIGDVVVQRKLFVAAEQGSGARLTQSVTNPTAAPITTSVFVGDLRANPAAGRLGSNTATRVVSTSSTPAPETGTPDPILSAADHWAVTTDGTGSDPAIAHVWGGLGAGGRATLARSGTETGAQTVGGAGALARDQFGYAWQDVTIAPGATASFVSWSAQRSALVPAFEATLAQGAAEEIETAPAEMTFEGMTAPEIASVRNWAKPAPSVAIAPVGNASSQADVALTASAATLAPDGLPQCGNGTLRWDFGDGTTATGASASHRFAAGTATVKLTATNACGGTRTAELSFVVKAPVDESQEVEAENSNDQPAPTPTPTPAPVTVPIAPGIPTLPQPAPRDPIEAPSPVAPIAAEPLTFTAPDRMPTSLIAKKGIATAIVSAVPGKLRVVLSGGGLKLVKTMTLAPGVPRTPTFKLTGRDLTALRSAKTLQVRAKLTTTSGQEIIISRFVAIKK